MTHSDLHPPSDTTLTLQAAHLEPLPVVVHVRNLNPDRPPAHSVFRLAHRPCVAGAGSDSDLLITDDAVSRRHVEMRVVAGGVALKDLGSRNGSYYLGQRFSDITLSLGSRITIGQTELEFVVDREDFEGTQGAARRSYGPLTGHSPAMQRLFTLMQRLEGSLVNVLIQGESGTGKELIARALHDRSLCHEGPFVAINCGALDRSLVRSELFGHKKGAFTGAHTEATGAFADADGGTLFLDEVGELPLDVQPILLRALESGSYTRVGETRARPVKVRLIAATHRNLTADVQDGLFRPDLFYRLMVVQLNAPPLRERREDIPDLVLSLAQAAALQSPPAHIIEELCKRSFPGNVRELKHALLAYAAIGELPLSTARPGPAEHPTGDSILSFIDPARPYAEQKEALVDRMTYLYLKALIERCQGNRSEAARVADLQRGYLRRLLHKYGLDGDASEDEPAGTR